MKIWQHILSWLYPSKCILCQRILEEEETDLCHACRVDTPQCDRTMAKYSFLTKWCALWRYEGNVRECLHRYKFLGRQSYAPVLGRLLAMKLLQEEMTEFHILTYVPISKRRLRRRGFDQVQLLAQHVAAELGIPLAATLEKNRHNKQQSRIHGAAKRRANVLGVYRTLPGVDLQDKRILLLDDIVTTGATASECARVLLTAGAKEVQLAVIATADHQK